MEDKVVSEQIVKLPPTKKFRPPKFSWMQRQHLAFKIDSLPLLILSKKIFSSITNINRS